MDIPKQFTINGQPIRVEILDKLEDNQYGNYNDAKELIQIAKTIEVNKEVIHLTQLQIENTFWHEVAHAFQFHSKGEYNEAEATIFGGMMAEFIRSSGIIHVEDNKSNE